MAIEFDCTQCGKPLFAQDRFAGRPIRCPGCGLTLSIPVPAGFSPAGLLDAPFPAQPAMALEPTASVPTPGEIVILGYEAFKRSWFLGTAMNVFYWMIMASVALALWLSVGWSALAPGHGGENPYRSGGFWVAQLVLWAASSLLTSGLYWAGVKMADRVQGNSSRPNPGDFFAGLQRPLTVLGVWFPLFVSTHLINILWYSCQWLFPALSTSMTGFGFRGAIFAFHVLFFVRLFWAVPLVMESSIGSWDALAASWRMTMGRSSLALVTWLMAVFLYLAGFCFCFVGACITGVLAQCLIGSFYRKITSAQNRSSG